MGLIAKWIANTFAKLERRIDPWDFDNRETGLTPLSLPMLMSIFYIWLCGIAAALLAFGLEMTIRHVVLNAKPS